MASLDDNIAENFDVVIGMDDFNFDKGFSFIWTIQNYNFCFRNNTDIFYESPTFGLEESCCEKWCFVLYPRRSFRHDNIGLVLRRVTGGKCRDITLHVSIRNIYGEFIQMLRVKLPFKSQPTRSSELKLILNQEVLKNYPNNDFLTIKCRIQHSKTEDLQTRKCYARTIIGVERIIYRCTLEGFEEFENGTRIEKQLIILSEKPIFSMDLSSTGETYAERKIEVKIKLIEPDKNCYCTCEISLISANLKKAHTVRDQFNFESSSPKQVWTFPFIQMSKILSNKKLYLPNGILTLRCEFAVSSGVTHNQVEITDYDFYYNHDLQCRDQTTDSDSTESLKNDLQQFYAEGKFSDLTIRTSTKEFRVHKAILCARSEVFSSMFKCDMKESREGVVKIEDVDDDTISKVLLFLYTDTVGEDLELGTASSLYFVADKYGILALKKKCSDFIERSFSVANVCDILVLAEIYQNKDLKTAAQIFIFEHSGSLMYSEQWKKFMKENVVLASEIMHTMLTKFQRS